MVFRYQSSKLDADSFEVQATRTFWDCRDKELDLGNELRRQSSKEVLFLRLIVVTRARRVGQEKGKRCVTNVLPFVRDS